MKRLVVIIALFCIGWICPALAQRNVDQMAFREIKSPQVVGERGLTLFPGNWLNASGAQLLTYSGGGYVNGSNAFGDLAKGQVFHNDKPYIMEGASFWIGALEGNTGSVNFTIWNFNGEPGSVIASKSMSIAQLKTLVLYADPFYIEFDQPVQVPKDFMIGIELSDLASAQIGLISSKDGDGGGLNLVWEQWNTGSWYSYQDAGSWDIDIDLAIFPSVIEEQNNDFAGGTGSPEDPYQVANATQLNKVRNYANDYFIQTADIDLGVAPWNAEKGWQPIGNILQPFTGNYNGDKHTIRNLTINRPGTDFQGLFGYLSSSEISNLILSNVNVKGYQYTAALAGKAESSGLNKIEIQGKIEGGNYAGGVCGLFSGGKLEKASVHAQIKGRSYTGGIAGYVDALAQINQSYSYGDVLGQDYVGGIAGFIGDEKPRTISGPGGVIITLPHGIPESAVTIKATDGSGLLRSGETSASPAITIDLGGKDFITGSRDAGAGMPLFEIRFPVTLANPINDRLRVRVKLFSDVILPVYGNFDPVLKMYTIYTYGLGNSWTLGTIDGNAVKPIGVTGLDNGPRVPSENKWTTLEFEIKDESRAVPKPISEDNIRTFIKPIARDILIEFQSAGFTAPDLIPDSSNAYKMYLIDSDMGHGVKESSYYTAPTAGLLGAIYIYYPSYIKDYQNLATWNLKNVISHEVFHAVQSGYGANFSVVQSAYYAGNHNNAGYTRSVTAYWEGTATLVGASYASSSTIAEGSAKIDEDFPQQNLGNALDDYNSSPYAKQDFYAFLSKRHFNSSLTFLNPLWRSFAKIAPFNPNESTGDILLKYRQGFDQFLRSSSLSLPSVYTDFAMQRLYIHDPQYLLRENEINGDYFKKNRLASILLTENKTYKIWESKTQESFQFDLLKFTEVKPLSAVAANFVIPQNLEPENKVDTLSFDISLSGNGTVNQNLDEQGFRIVIIRENFGVPALEDPVVVVKDIKKPVKVQIKDGISNLIFIAINAYVDEVSPDLSINLSGDRVHNVTQKKWYTRIQDAMNEGKDGDTVKVLPGTFYEAVNFKGKNIKLWSADGPENTIIDGQGVAFPYGVLFNSGKSNLAELRGFTIKNWSQGGIGIYKGTDETKPTITQNTIANNKKGIIIDDSSPHIEGNIIKDNTSETESYTVGIVITGNSFPIIENNTISNNGTPEESGGGIDVGSSGIAEIKNNIISDNKALIGGGIYITGSSPIIYKNIIERNTASRGGGILVSGDVDDYNSAKPVISENIIRSNVALSSGAGVTIAKAAPTLSNNSISSNKAIGEYGDGGGMDCDFCGGSIVNNVFNANETTRFGGGMNIEHSIATITGNTFSNNYAGEHGGGISGASIGGWPLWATVKDNNGYDRTVIRYVPCFDEPNNTYINNTHAKIISEWGPGNGNWCNNAGYNVHFR